MSIRSDYWVLLVTVLFGVGAPQRHDIQQMMFKQLPGAAGCFRRLNGTHQFGCTSPRLGSYGVVLMAGTEDELQLLENASAGPYMVVLSPILFQEKFLVKIMSFDKVSGVALASGWGSNPTQYSPDDKCPNSRFSDCSSPWNPSGNSFLVRDWPKPIFLVNDDSNLQELIKCHKLNLPVDESQLSKPLCSLHMKSHMFAAGDSNICLRKLNHHLVSTFKYCDPLGNENIVLPVINKNETKSKRIVMVGSRIDSASLFDGIAPGAMGSVSGLVTLLLTAQMFNDVSETVLSHGVDQGLMFAAFNGESFDFIGSQRTVYDMEHGQFLTATNKVSVDDLSAFIDISQVGPNSRFFIHRTDDSSSKAIASSLISHGVGYNVTVEESSRPGIPPVSLTTFLKAKPNLTGVAITNYDAVFTNQFYNGIYDVASNLNYTPNAKSNSVQRVLAQVAATVVQTVIGLVLNDSVKFTINSEKYVETADELLQCYLVTRNCSLIRRVYPSLASNPKLPPVLPLYVGVQPSVNYVTSATGLLMAYLASPRTNIPQENCSSSCTGREDLRCFWFDSETKSGTGECIVTSMKLTTAVSPAFEIDNYDWTSGLYSTWTESVWDENSLRLFLKPSRKQEFVIFFVGVAVSIASFSITLYAKRKSGVWLALQPSPERC